MFLPITFVHRDKNNSPVVGKEQPANDSLGVLKSSPQESDTVIVQSHSITKGASDTKTAQSPGVTRKNSETSQPPSMKRRDSDTTITTAQPQSLTKKDEMSSKCKVQHDYEPLLDLVMYVHILVIYFIYLYKHGLNTDKNSV